MEIFTAGLRETCLPAQSESIAGSFFLLIFFHASQVTLVIIRSQGASSADRRIFSVSVSISLAISPYDRLDGTPLRKRIPERCSYLRGTSVPTALFCLHCALWF